jgi:septal ring factor EnvC (AmiA/AmiB activator)
MDWWKNLIIGSIAFLLVFGLGFGTATILFSSTSSDLRGRIKQITRERDEALYAEQQAKERATQLADNLRQSESRVDDLTNGIIRLSETNRCLTEGFDRLESSITILSSGIRGITDSVTESGGLIQESMGLLLDVSKRNGKTNK